MDLFELVKKRIEEAKPVDLSPEGTKPASASRPSSRAGSSTGSKTWSDLSDQIQASGRERSGNLDRAMTSSVLQQRRAERAEASIDTVSMAAPSVGRNPDDIREDLDKAKWDLYFDNLEKQYTDPAYPGKNTEPSPVQQKYDALQAELDTQERKLGAVSHTIQTQRMDRAWQRLSLDKEAQELYKVAQNSGSGEQMVRRMLDNLDRGGVPEDDQSALTDIAARYGISPETSGSVGAYMNDLSALLRSGDLSDRVNPQISAIEELAKRGYDFGAMEEYRRDQEAAEEAEKRKQETAELAEEHPVAASIATIAAVPLQGLDYVDTALRTIGRSDPTDLENYRPLNTDRMTFTNFVSTVRGTVGDKIEDSVDSEILGSVARFFYDTAMSIGDSAVQVALLGPASLATMGGAAAANTAADVIARGGSNQQVILAGAAAGIAEMFFEKFSVERLLNIKSVSSARELVDTVVKQSGVEASEEMFTEIANILSDAAIMGQYSDFATAVQYYKSQGASDEEAKRKAYLDMVARVAVAGAGGFISGGVMGGGKAALQNVRVWAADNMTGRQLRQASVNFGMVEQALKYGTDSETYRRASDIAQRLDNSTSGGPGSVLNAVKDSEYGRLARLMADELGTKGPRNEQDQIAAAQAARPDEKVASPTMQAYLEVGDSATDAEVKAGIMDRVLDGDTRLNNTQLRKLKLNTPRGKSVFERLTGVKVPSTSDTKTLISTARTAVTQAAERKIAAATETTRAEAGAQAGPVTEAAGTEPQTGAPEAVAPTTRADSAAAAWRGAPSAVQSQENFMAQLEQEAAMAAQEAETKSSPNVEPAAAFMPEGSAQSSASLLGQLEQEAAEAARDAEVKSPRTSEPAAAFIPEGVTRREDRTDMRRARVVPQEQVQGKRGKSRGRRYAATESRTQSDTVSQVMESTTERKPTQEQEWTAKYATAMLRGTSVKNVRVAFEGFSGQENAYYQDGEIVLNGNRLTTQRAINYILGHELTHPGADADANLVQSILDLGDRLLGGDIMSTRLTTTRERYIRSYMRNHGMSRTQAEAKVTPELAKEETAADLMAELFETPGALERMGRESTGAKVLRAARDALRRMLDSLTGKGSQSVQNEAEMLLERLNRALRSRESRGTMEQKEARSSVGGEENGPAGGQQKEMDRDSLPGGERIERLASERGAGTASGRGSGPTGSGVREGQIGFGGRSAAERARLTEILVTPVDNDPELRNFIRGFSLYDAAEMLSDGIDRGSQMIRDMMDTIPGFAKAVADAKAYANRGETIRGSSEGAVAENATGQDSLHRTLTPEQQAYFARSAARDAEGNLLRLFHGSRTDVFTEFDLYEGVWMTTDMEYARNYAELRGQNSELEERVYTDEGLRVFELYANITNPLELGEINGALTDGKAAELADALGVDYAELKGLVDDYMGENTYSLTRSRDFIELASRQGFDGMRATEDGVETWCAIGSPDQVKLTGNKKPTDDRDIRYSISSEQPFAEQVTRALTEDPTENWYRALYIRETPITLRGIGLGDLPLTITTKHIRNINHAEDPSGQHPEWHGIDKETLIRLPQLLERPVVIMDSATVPGDVVVVTAEVDDHGRPVVASIRPNGTAYVDGKVGPANFITSIYGRNGYTAWVNQAVRDGRVLYWNKNRSQNLSVTGKVQFPASLTGLASNTIIKRHAGYVKDNIPERRFSVARDSEGREQADKRYSFGGVRAQNADLEALSRAKEMEQQGVAMETIFRETGWYTGIDGKWRFEISDYDMEYDRPDNMQWDPATAPQEMLLSDVLHHDELFRNYPHLRRARLRFERLPLGRQGVFDGENIILDDGLRGVPDYILVHEIQHAIQEYEGFARGSSPEYWAQRIGEGYARQGEDGTPMSSRDLYRNTAGEIEARDASNRILMTPERRRKNLPKRGNENTVFVEDEPDGANGRSYSVSDEDINPDTGYRRGSIEDSFMRIVNAGDEQRALDMLQSMLERMAAFEATRAERSNPADAFRPKPELTEDLVAKNRAAIQSLIDKYGRLEQTRTAARRVDLPKQIDDNTKVRGVIRTAASAKATPDALVSEFERSVLDGDAGYTYVPISDKSVLDKVKGWIEENGFAAELREWQSAIDSNKSMTKEDIARGEQLYVEACANKDLETAQRLVAELAMVGTQYGQVIQAISMLHKLSPTGQLYYLQKTAEHMTREYRQSGKNIKVLIDPELADQLLEASTKEEIDVAMDQIIADIARQLPVTIWDKWDAWRYLAMLGNPTTHIRNMLSNAVFTPVRMTKDLVGIALETMFIRDRGQRTKGFATKEAREFAKADALVMQDILRTGGKHNITDRIREAKQIFNFKALEWARIKNTAALEAEDWIFLRRAYVNALSGFLSARGVDLSTLQGEGETREGRRLLNEARAYAVREAQKATYRDMNTMASILNQFRRAKNPFVRFAFGGLLPFTKTPFNIVRRGVEYSPIGLVGTIRTAVKGGSSAEILDRLSASFTGTGLLVAGYFLAKAGLLIGGMGDDPEDEFQKLQGIQPYSFQIGDHNYTIDWLAPTVLPLFVGAELHRMTNGEVEAEDAYEAMMTVLEPVMALSMMSGLNDTLAAVRYEDQDEMIVAMLRNMVGNYFTQGVPTILGRVARTMDDSRRTSFVSADAKPTESWLSRTFQSSVLGKIPVAAEGRMLYIDAWGRADTEENAGFRALENFLSPGYYNEVRTTAVDEELMRLAEATNSTAVFPKRAEKSFKVNKETYAMTQEEYQEHLIERGQTSYQLVSDLISSPVYAGMSDKEKAKAVEKCYDYAAQMANLHTNSNYGVDPWVVKLEQMTGEGLDADDYFTAYAMTQEKGQNMKEVISSTNRYDGTTAAMLMAMDFDADDFTDPYARRYEYKLTDGQRETYRGLFVERLSSELSYLMSDDWYLDASAEERLEMLDETWSDVKDEVKRDMADWLWDHGIESTEKE